MRYSFQKEAILNILNKTENHYSVEEIHTKLLQVIPMVSLMTVYRNLSKLANEGHVLPFHVDNVLHFCGNEKTHHHLSCVKCGKVTDGFDTKMYDAVLNNVKSEDFLPLSNGIVIKGLCRTCS